MHEILHSLGFWHEQSRPDRDHFVEVMWENILDGTFRKLIIILHKKDDDLGSKHTRCPLRDDLQVKYWEIVL